MFKAKNIMVILIVNYLLIVIASAFSEMFFISSKAQNLQLMIRTAGDMALEQVQATDDFFKPNEGYMLEDGVAGNDYTMFVASSAGDGYKRVNAFSAVTGRNDKDGIFEYLYVKDSDGVSRLQKYIDENPGVLDIEITGAYWKEGFDNIRWCKVPRIAQVGLEATGPAAKRAYGSNEGSAGLDRENLNSIWTMYELDKTKKQATTGDGGVVEYHMTPLSLGVTYIDEELLQIYFMNNMDLLMRGKYAKEGKNLNEAEGGNGVYKGELYSELVSQPGANPINNGEFTLLRGDAKTDPATGVRLYKGITPEVRYKVIDMFDKRNDELLSLLFGPKPVVAGSKAEYFKSISDFSTDPMTGFAYTEKPIVIAEVTFKADVIVPYSSVALREMRGKETGGELTGRFLFDTDNLSAKAGNFLDIEREGSLSTGENGGMGNSSDVLYYRKVFAVAP